MIELVEDVKTLQDLVGTCCSSATDLTCAFWRIRCDCCMENAWQSKLIMDTRTIVYQIGLLQLSAHPSRWIYYIYIYIQNLVPTCATRNSTLVTFPLGASNFAMAQRKCQSSTQGLGQRTPEVDQDKWICNDCTHQSFSIASGRTRQKTNQIQRQISNRFWDPISIGWC